MGIGGNCLDALKSGKITEDDLDGKFFYDNTNDWLVKIHLGEHKKFSKKKYKQALGNLYKSKKIRITNKSITLILQT